MKNRRILLFGITAMLAVVTAASTPVHAARRMLVLIDTSGSMTAAATDHDGNPTDRFGAAKSWASFWIGFYAGQGALPVAVYTFAGDDMPPICHTCRPGDTVGFIDSNEALDAIECLTASPSPALCGTTPDGGAPFLVGGNTPLAGAMCAVADKLVNSSSAGDSMILQVESDGEENSTATGLCAGVPPGAGGTFDPVTNTWSPGTSWQAKVVNHITSEPKPTGSTLAVNGDLYELQGLLTLRAPGQPDPEGILTPEARLLASTPAASTGLNPLEQFFISLAQATGGRVTIIHDDGPPPVVGDFTGDRCVDHADAISVARAFGPIAPPADGTFDLNLDGVVDFADYLIQLSLITGTCGREPYVASQPIVCKDAARVVIDGQSIEDRGITIDARGSCEITIKNSLIVSGKNAIKIVGSAAIIVDNSIIVGQGAVLVQHGAGVLSAANSVFHGKLDTHGAFQYIDRGGNVFE